MAVTSYFVMLIALLIPSILCCGQMNVTLVEVNNDCEDGSTSLMQLSENFGFEISDDCVLSPLGCVNTTKDFDTAKLHFKISIGEVTVSEGDEDGCVAMKGASENKEISTVTNLFQIPKSCPVTTGKVCADGKTVSLAEYKDKLPFSPGNVNGEFVLDHGAAGKSCFNFELCFSLK